MEKLHCKACGSYSMVPMDVTVEQGEEVLFQPDQESRFYTCHVCGDNWLTLRETESDGDTKVTFVHQMGMAPVLKRVAHLPTPVELSDQTVDYWEYFMDDEEIDEEIWRDKLVKRRKILKSICSN